MLQWLDARPGAILIIILDTHRAVHIPPVHEFDNQIVLGKGLQSLPDRLISDATVLLGNGFIYMAASVHAHSSGRPSYMPSQSWESSVINPSLRRIAQTISTVL